MDEIKIPEGAHDHKFWDSWNNNLRPLLERNTPWAKNRERWEAVGGVAARPINFPHFEDELVIFPRVKMMRLYYDLKDDPKYRTRWYKIKLQELSGNIKQEGRGVHTFLIVPQTYDRLDRQIASRRGNSTEEIRRVLYELYYKGRRSEEVDAQVSTKTLIRALTDAEEDLNILGGLRGTLKISLKTLDISYTAMRYGREAKIDIRPYFYPRIF